MILLSEAAAVATGDFDSSALKKMKAELTINNPEILKRTQLGLSLMGMAPTIKMFKLSKDGETLTMPIGYAETAMKYLTDFDPITDLVDIRSIGKPLKTKFTGKLRPYQREALNALKQPTIGVISAPTGSGKTVLMCALIAKKKVSTLVLVNTIELANQFKANLLKFTDLEDEEIHIISGGVRFQLKPVTIALLQSMHKMDKDLFELVNENMGMVPFPLGISLVECALRFQDY